MALPTESVYCMTKAAIAHLTKCLAVEWAPHGINVNAVAPTFIRTPGTVKWLADDAFRRDLLVAHPARPRRRADRRRRRRRLPRLARGVDGHRHDAADRRRLDGALTDSRRLRQQRRFAHEIVGPHRHPVGVAVAHRRRPPAGRGGEERAD